MEENLLFFDKEGNSLNFSFNQDLKRHEGDLIFHENSSDTFKTQALYLFEKVPAFEYENNPFLTIKKFQLFNEHGFNFYSGQDPFQIKKIEPVNEESDYYSKWIYGVDFESKFRIGTFVRFDSSIFEFNDPNIVYSVVSSKKDAVMIISNVTNYTFEQMYGGTYSGTASYQGKNLSGVDIIGIYDYLKTIPSYQTNLSYWNEHDFSNRIYPNRRLNVANTQLNDEYSIGSSYDDVGILTVKNSVVVDAVHHSYQVSQVPTYSTLFMEVITKTDLPLIYEGPMIFMTQSKAVSFGEEIPTILKPGVEFKVTNSNLNTSFLTISPIMSFDGNVNLRLYATGSQVIYNNRIYQCIQSHTWSGGMSVSITPDNSQYWSDPTYLPVNSSLTYESLLNGFLYLTTDHLYFTQSYVGSSDVTLSTAAEKFANDLQYLNIESRYESGKLISDLIYPSKYAEINYYYDVISTTHSIGTFSEIRERSIETFERLKKEFNYDLSENFSFNIVFTDIDEYGIIIVVNKVEYQERVSWVYSSGQVDMVRTIDKTLRNWITRHFVGLITLGIVPSLSTIGIMSPYFNSINLQTEYPNVSIDFSVKIGSTGNYYIENSSVYIYDMGRYLSINVNDREYGQSFISDVPTTISSWIDQYQDTLESFGIFVSMQASSLNFNTKEKNQRVEILVNVGKTSDTGIDLYKIVKKSKGNVGPIISSNEILSGTSSSFESAGFSTGMVVGINKTFHPIQNAEFNILYLDPDVMNLSYQGPFWGLSSSICNSSAFTTVAFTIGFGQTACPDTFLPDLYKGMFDDGAFDASFSIENSSTSTYSITYYPVSTNNLADIMYLQSSNSIYALGDDISVIDAVTSEVITSIPMTGNSKSMKLEFNSNTSYLYALSENSLFRIDPFINQVVFTYSFINDTNDILTNPVNGDIYISFDTEVLVYNGSTLVNTIGVPGYKMSYNLFEDRIYINSSGSVVAVSGSTRLVVSSYSLGSVGQYSSIEYDHENESMYVAAGTGLYKIDNGFLSSSLLAIGSTFSNLLFNNLTSNMVVSSQNNNVSSIHVDTDVIEWTGGSGNRGFLSLNEHDGSIYMSSQSSNSLLVISPVGASGSINVLETFTFSTPIRQLTYNADRRSIWVIQPSTKNLIEIRVDLGGTFNLEFVDLQNSNENFYGTLDKDYEDRNYLWLNTREYIRGPRENFTGGATVSIYAKWLSDNVPEFFLYDFSGDQLPDFGVFRYIGEKPLSTIHLNRKSNRDLDKISLPEYQQTIFNTIEHKLNFIDDSNDIHITPKPIEFFIGYNDSNEGSLRSILQIFKKEEIDFTITTNISNLDIISFETISEDDGMYGRISLDPNSTSYFTTDGISSRGLKVGQHLAIFVKDVTNQKKQFISNNNGFLVKIRNVYSRIIEVDFFKDIDNFESQTTLIKDYPKNGSTTYLSCRFKVWDKEISRFNIFGQTEIEDPRFKIELNNTGKLISSDDVYIFKEYDIKEEGIDWVFLNQKRKEMLMMRNLIYPYIGSYKSIINAINYFGYNDLELYEYYRNIDEDSANYFKLFKVEIPDIFDNTVEGWTENDFIKHTFPNPKFEDTNLFNLTYRITDREGNNVLSYTLEEVQKKLQGLKYWLQKNIIPITHKILDITGRADFVGDVTISHLTRDVSILNIKEDFTPVSFSLNEAYLMPVNNGSTVYNCVLDFSTSSTYSLPDCYTIDIKSYEIYREWYAFKNYDIGEKVIYYSRAYESIIENNKTNNPRKFESVPNWKYDTIYKIADIVKYDREVYVYSDQGSTYSSTTAPVNDSENWLNVTEWKEIDLSPVESFNEYRDIDNLNPYNFTIDSNISPYLVISVNSFNGYGMNYTDHKNYEIRGLLDLRELESFANLTSKQYRKSLPIVSP